MCTYWSDIQADLTAETPEVGGPQILGYQLTLFGPRGADYAHHITTGPPIFLDDAAPLSTFSISKVPGLVRYQIGTK